MPGKMLRRVGLAEGVDTPVLAVDVQDGVGIVLPGQLRAALLCQLVHNHVPHICRKGTLLGCPQQHRVEGGHAVLEQVVVQGSVIGVPEVQLQGFLLLLHLGGGAVELHAAVLPEALLSVKKGDGTGPLIVLGEVGIQAGAAEQVLRIGHQTCHRQAVALVDDIAQIQTVALQLARFHAHRPNHRGGADGDRAGIPFRRRRRPAAVQGVINLAFGPQFQGDAVHAIKDSIPGQSFRPPGDQHRPAAVFPAHAAAAEVEEALLLRHSAEAAVGGEPMERYTVPDLPCLVGQIQLLPQAVQGEGYALIAGDNSQFPGCQGSGRKLPGQQLLSAVRQIVFAEKDVVVGIVAQFNLVVILLVLAGVQAVEAHDLVDGQFRRPALGHGRLIAGLIVGKAWAGQGAGPGLPVLAGKPALVRLGSAKAEAVELRPGSVPKAQFFPLGRQGKADPAAVIVLAAIQQQIFPCRQLPLRQGPAVAAVRQGAAAQFRRFGAGIVQLDPVGKIPLRIHQESLIVSHDLADAQPLRPASRLRLASGTAGQQHRQQQEQQHRQAISSFQSLHLLSCKPRPGRLPLSSCQNGLLPMGSLHAYQAILSGL